MENYIPFSSAHPLQVLIMSEFTTRIPSRYITGHDASGASVFTYEGEVTHSTVPNPVGHPVIFAVSLFVSSSLLLSPPPPKPLLLTSASSYLLFPPSPLLFLNSFLSSCLPLQN